MYISIRAQADIPHQHNNSHSKVSCLLRFVVIIIVKGMTNEKEGEALDPHPTKKTHSAHHSKRECSPHAVLYMPHE